MPAVKIYPKLSVGPQPSIEDIVSLYDEGFTTLMNNRPDNEDEVQPGTHVERQEADRSNLSYAFIEQSEERVYAHCKAGTPLDALQGATWS